MMVHSCVALIGLLLLLLCLTAGAQASRRSQGDSIWGRPIIRDLSTRHHDTFQNTPCRENFIRSTLNDLRGGAETEIKDSAEPVSLDDKVHAAMRKLGLTPPSEAMDTNVDVDTNTGTTVTADEVTTASTADECENGVCPMPAPSTMQSQQPQEQEDVSALASRLAQDLHVDESLAMAALGATSSFIHNSNNSDDERQYDEEAARDMIQQEMHFIDTAVDAESPQVRELVEEGHNAFLARRALAFAEMNMDDARAILVADEMDAKEETEARELQQQQEQGYDEAEEEASPEPPMKTVTVNADFDPTQSAIAPPSAPQEEQQQQAPPPARKEDVVFDASAAQIQELVLESPVPVLVDVYADWCGPCKALTPVLEEMAVKGGGMFRLVKINSDNERAISSALDVSALPTVFGVRDGKILHMFQGMPRSEQAMRNFMMGILLPGAKFDPSVTAKELETYARLSSKLAKTAGGAAFSFSARERLQDRMTTRLDDLVQARDGDMADAEDSAKIVRSLLSNVIRNPMEMKFRHVNLGNKVIAEKVGKYPACLAMLKGVGFALNADGNSMVLAKMKQTVNVAPLAVARDCIDKWMDQNRHKVAAAARKRRDEIAQQQLAEEKAAVGDDDDDEEENDQEEVDPNATTVRVRIEGKKKTHELSLSADDPLSSIVDALPLVIDDKEELRITCAAKRLVITTIDTEAMKKSLRSHGLFPAASVVVRIGDGASTGVSSSKLAERVSTQKSRKKKGSHTMQSVGIYGKDDNAKGELIDGGGGVWFEHDVTDDEDEATGEEPQGDEQDDDEAPEGEESDR